MSKSTHQASINGKSNEKKSKFSGFSFPLLDLYGRSPTFLIEGEDSHGTRFGCLLSLVVIVIMTGISGFYIWRFFVRGESSVAETQIAEEEFGALNLTSSKFFMSIVYKNEKGKTLTYKRVEDTLIGVEIYEVLNEGSTGEDVKPNITRTKLKLGTCSDLVQSGNYVGKKDPLGTTARCVSFEGDREIKGTAGDPEFKYLEIVINPCPAAAAACISSNLKPADTYTSSADYRSVFKQLNGLTLTFSFLDAAGDPDNFESPISYNINSDHKIRLNMQQTKYLDLHFGLYEMVTKYGVYYPYQQLEESITLQNAFYDSTHRKPGAEIFEFKSPEGEKTRTAPYGVIVVQASNRRITVEREYETLIDAFGNIGGAAEAITFIVAILLIFHTDIRYEQRILNEGLLREKKRKDEKKQEAKPERQDPYLKTVTYTQFDENGIPIEVKKQYKVRNLFNCLEG